jgi:hypothetical protein
MHLTKFCTSSTNAVSNREGFSIQLAVVGPVVPDLLGEVAAQKAPYFF